MGAVVCCPNCGHVHQVILSDAEYSARSRGTVSLASRLRPQLRPRRQCSQGDASSRPRQPQTPMRLFVDVVAFIASGDAVTAAILPPATNVEVNHHDYQRR